MTWIASHFRSVWPDNWRSRQGTKVCRYNWHSAGSLGRLFPILKYKYISRIKYTETILSDSTRKLLWFEITKMPIAVYRKQIYRVARYNFQHNFVAYCCWFQLSLTRWLEVTMSVCQWRGRVDGDKLPDDTMSSQTSASSFPISVISSAYRHIFGGWKFPPPQKNLQFPLPNLLPNCVL